METLIIGFVVLTMTLWFCALNNISRSRFKNPKMNLVWLLVVLYFPVLGSIFYFQMRKEFVTKESRRFLPNFNRAELINQ